MTDDGHLNFPIYAPPKEDGIERDYEVDAYLSEDPRLIAGLSKEHFYPSIGQCGTCPARPRRRTERNDRRIRQQPTRHVDPDDLTRNRPRQVQPRPGARHRQALDGAAAKAKLTHPLA